MLPPELNVTLFLPSIVRLQSSCRERVICCFFSAATQDAWTSCRMKPRTYLGKYTCPISPEGETTSAFNPLTFSLCFREKGYKSVWGKTGAGDDRKVKSETSVVFNNERGSKEQGFRTLHPWPFLSLHLHSSCLSLARPTSANTPWCSKTLLALWN